MTEKLKVKLVIFELRVTIYCTSYEFLFTYNIRLINYCTSYELIFGVSYELVLLHELQVNFYIGVASYYLLHKMRLQC